MNVLRFCGCVHTIQDTINQHCLVSTLCILPRPGFSVVVSLYISVCLSPYVCVCTSKSEQCIGGILRFYSICCQLGFVHAGAIAARLSDYDDALRSLLRSAYDLRVKSMLSARKVFVGCEVMQCFWPLSL